MELKISAVDEKTSDFPEEFFRSPVFCCALLEGVGLFELMGVSWMMALRFQNWSHEVHEHAYDEVRHTKMIQDAVRFLRWELDDQSAIYENRLSKVFYQETEKYLQNLSKRVFRLTYHQKSCDSQFAISSYALLAFLIERRIMKIYPYLAKFGCHQAIQDLAKEIIGDERQHLTLVTGKLPSGLDFADSSQDKLILLEKELAAKWIDSLKAACSVLPAGVL